MKIGPPNLILSLALLWLGGCGQAPERVAGPPSQFDNPAQLEVGFERLPQDIVRAVDQCHWGLLRKRVRDDGVFECEVLLPDERRAFIEATSKAKGTASVLIRVGMQGDGRLEHHFLKTLRRTLASKPLPPRGGKFELPAQF